MRMPRSPRPARSGQTPQVVEFLDRLLGAFAAQGRTGVALAEAARWGCVAYLQDELARGTPVDTPADNGGTALMYAASGGQLPAMRLLLDAGADVNARDRDKGMTPLMWNLAALHTPKVYLNCCRLLLERGADPNFRAADGKGAWWWANDRENKEDLLALLRSFGASAESGA